MSSRKKFLQALLYYSIYPVLWIISILPFRILYFLSDVLSVFVYYILKYRRKVVRSNLKLVFPKYSLQQIVEVERLYYSYLCDFFLEMVKTLSISFDQIQKRFVVTNPEVLVQIEKNTKGSIVLLGHYASFEWISSLNLSTKIDLVGVYKPIKNIYFDKLIHRIRARFGARVISNRVIAREILADTKKGITTAYGMVSDQTPKKDYNKYFADFMGVNVPVFIGGEALAKRLDLNLYYLRINRVKRGYYQAEFVPLKKGNIKDPQDFSATDEYLSLLEKQIRDQPAFYYWIHRRWKFKRD